MTEVSAVEVSSTTRPSNGETLITLVLDETGSMMSCYDSTISSVNDYIGSQQNAPGVAKVNLYTFSSTGSFGYATAPSGINMNKAMSEARSTGNSIRTVFENTEVSEVGFLSRENYRPNGGTNLYDAIGHTIRRVEDQLSPLAEVPNVLIVIVTDGGENASTEYDLKAIQSLIKDKEGQGWTFVYLGANQDAWSVAKSFGLSQGQAMTYDTNNMEGTMATLASATSVYRSTRATGEVAQGSVTREFFSGKEGSHENSK